MNTPSNIQTTRRDFLKTSALVGGALAAPAILPGSLFAKENNETLRVGLIGCGGRGTGAASQALSADKNAVLVAMGDVFEEQLQASLKSLQQGHPDSVKVTPEKSFIGLDAYQKVIENVDVVLLATPPGFRPTHLKAAIDAGKHVFCEKPMATDAPGVRSVMESAKTAKEKNLALVAGFCWRYDIPRREFYKRIHDGARPTVPWHIFVMLLLDQKDHRFIPVRHAYGFFPIIALAAKAVTIPKGKFTSRR